ncbi:PREDICTED: major facilitator superfamily domain-containing protein 6-A [Papilio polytes]|uniref:major facilitator superfamily domain-containing protein 6-A n=1 Tax=Papilio polytes TaxID=76194 RepID=UPI000676A951|nr:PREDICTED: major facilitator superfamily domain-containing protein 6-A [Papilio polytes]
MLKNMKVDKKLLPIKGHYFLFNAGTAPLVPYLSTYARQLGFSSATVGLIYTVLPIFGLVAKPLFGIIADRFKRQKSIFILFQIVTIVSFSAIYTIPGETGNTSSVQLECGNGASFLRSCYQDAKSINQCSKNSLGNLNGTSKCNMSCEMNSPKMWQTVCEHWHMPQYCYSETDLIEYTAHINNADLRDDQCLYLNTDAVKLDGYPYTPHCHIGEGYRDLNQSCAMNCTNSKLFSAIGNSKPIMTCSNKLLNFRLCSNDTNALKEAATQTNDECQVSCDLDKSAPWRLMEICEAWGADAAKTCRPKTRIGTEFPKNLSFVGSVLLSTVITEEECAFVQLNHIKLPDGSIHYPNCMKKAAFETGKDIFYPSCNIQCDNMAINEWFQSATESRNNSTQYTRQFWLFFLLMIISWIGQAVVVTFADAICFNVLGPQVALYGKQRLWGSVGWGIFSLLTGTLIDWFSEGAYKDYTIAFILMFVFMCGDVIVSCFIKSESTKMSVNILIDVGTLLSSIPTLVFMLWTIAVGLCTGLLWQFLFWLLEDIYGCDNSDYVKTLQGLVSAIQTFGGEIPFMFASGYILKKLGHVNMMSLVLFAFGVRFVLYSLLTNAWWVLPIEMLQGITFGMFYPTMASYANVVSPPGTETTVQGLVGAVFEGVGTSLGSFIGGRLYETYGGSNTFLWFGIGSLICCVVHVFVQYLIRDKVRHAELTKAYSSIMRYENLYDPNYILQEMTDFNAEH